MGPASSPSVQPPSHTGSEKEPIQRHRRFLDFADSLSSLDIALELVHLDYHVENGQSLMGLQECRHWAVEGAAAGQKLSAQHVVVWLVLLIVPQCYVHTPQTVGVSHELELSCDYVSRTGLR
jgi:hypothetical protein